MIDFKGHRFEKNIILLCVRCYLAYSLSYRNLEEMMRERGVEIGHSNILSAPLFFAKEALIEFLKKMSLRKSHNRPFPVSVSSWL